MAQEAMLGKAHHGKKAQAIVLRENIQVKIELFNLETPPKVDVVHTSTSSRKFYPSSSGAKSWADQVKAEIPISKVSIWDSFDISKLSNVVFKLDYVAPEMQGETPISVIELRDNESKIKYWKTIVVCYVLGAYPPFDVLRMRGQISHFDNKPFIVKSWNPDMEYTKDELNTVPIWINLVGKPLIVDHFARLLVEVQMDSKLPNIILFKNERDLIVEKKVLYECKPTLCCFCSKYGHSENECRKKKVPVQKQQPKKQVAPPDVTSDVVPIAHGVVVDSQEKQVQEKQKHTKAQQGEM
ncbi:hypothetical protein H5410_064802 [Solanum commersonii]|uniref:DUF4283 domain-containing protein n=1 Tax=Solanum commersonii TaxID=4109 RepID=A0A9J5VZ07_SOLCO|nr:hypothetical protein H5410_064802 [Solanum commersonii]